VTTRIRDTGTTPWWLPVVGLCLLVLVACTLVVTLPTVHSITVPGR
jgi:hypothetical protein